MGKGPEKIKVWFHGNWVIAYMGGSLSPVERFIVQSEKGRVMIWQARTQLIKELYHMVRPTEMEDLVGAKFIRLFTDVDVIRDEVVSVFIFDRPIDGSHLMITL